MMRTAPLQRTKIPTAVARVSRSRAYADYKLQDEHDPLLYTGANKQDERSAASEAAQAITALIKQLSILRRTISRGIGTRQQKHPISMQASTIHAADFQQEYDACLDLFNEYPALHRTWKQALTDSLTSSACDPFAVNGPAASVQKVIDQIERTPACLLIEPKLLSRMIGSTGYNYSPFTQLQPYSMTINSLSLLIQRQG
jgi:hypothetical protein